MKVTIKELLAAADREKYAVPAFNVYNLETLMGIMQAAEEKRAPVILQVYSRLFESGNAELLAPSVHKVMEKMTVPAAFHLDHGSGQEAVMRALRYGATGIMIDYSMLPLEENIAGTKRIAELCQPCGVPVEGELGHVGTTADDSFTAFTSPMEAATFVEKTGVCALAVLVGNAHGHYKKAPNIDIERIGEIYRRTGCPVVLHGGTGIPDDQIQAAIAAGIRKVNFGTDVCCSFLKGVDQASRDKVALDLFLRDAVQCVKDYAMEKMDVLGATGHG